MTHQIGVIFVLPLLTSTPLAEHVHPVETHVHLVETQQVLLWPMAQKWGLPRDLRHWFNAEARRVEHGVGRVFLASSTTGRAPDTTDFLVVVKFEGNCDASAEPRRGASTTLGSVYLSDGRVSPHMRVDCDAILRAIHPRISHLTVDRQRQLLAKAILRVTLHELRHIEEQSAAHRRHGIHKASLSAEDLIRDWANYERVQ